MFETIRAQIITIEEYLRTLGYDRVSVYNFSIMQDEISVCLIAKDDFQAEIAAQHRYKQFSYDSLTAETLAELWSVIYALPSRATRELHVLANQLSGIAGMESQLRNVRIQQMIAPILEAREEMKKLLVAPSEVLEPVAVHLDDELPF